MSVTCHKLPFFCRISLEKIFFQHNKIIFRFFSKKDLTFHDYAFRKGPFSGKDFRHKFC